MSDLIEETTKKEEKTTPKTQQKPATPEELLVIFKEQLLGAFTTAGLLRNAGYQFSTIMQNSILTVADQLPDKTLAHSMRKALFGRTTEVVMKEQPLVGQTRTRATAPLYNTAQVVNQPQSIDEEKPANEVTTRFSAPQYTAVDDPNKKEVVPVVEGNEVASTAGEETAKELPTQYLEGKISLAELVEITPEALADNFAFDELKLILEAMGSKKKGNSKAAAAKRIKQLATA